MSKKFQVIIISILSLAALVLILLFSTKMVMNHSKTNAQSQPNSLETVQKTQNNASVASTGNTASPLSGQTTAHLTKSEPTATPAVQVVPAVAQPKHILAQTAGQPAKGTASTQISKLVNQGGPHIPVLLYHRLLTPQEMKSHHPESDIISTVAFDQQMTYLHDHGYHTITIQQLQGFLNGQTQLPKKSVMIQFDDGRLDILRYAYPEMKKYNFHGVAMLITSRESRTSEVWDPNKNQFLSWPQVAQIRDVFELGGHTNAMHEVNAQNRTDVVSSKLTYAQKLADLQTNHKLIGGGLAFAYPWGQYTAQTITLLKQAGFQLAFTTHYGYIQPHNNPYELNRFTIAPWINFDEFKKIASGMWH